MNRAPPSTFGDTLLTWAVWTLGIAVLCIGVLALLTGG